MVSLETDKDYDLMFLKEYKRLRKLKVQCGYSYCAQSLSMQSFPDLDEMEMKYTKAIQ